MNPLYRATRNRFLRSWEQEHHQQRRRSALGCNPCYHPAIIARCHPRTGVVVRHLVPRRWWQLPPLRPPPLPAWWPCRTAKTSPRNSIRYLLFALIFHSRLIYFRLLQLYFERACINISFINYRCRVNMEYPTKRTTQGTPKEDQWLEWGQSG